MNYLSVNLLPRSYRITYEQILKNAKQIPYCINPSLSDFEQLLKSSLSDFDESSKDWSGTNKNSMQVVRIGIDKKDNIYVWPGAIIHFNMASILGTEFIYTLRFETDAKTILETDEPKEYQNLNNEEKKKLVELINSKLNYLSIEYITCGFTDLVKFSDYITVNKNDKIDIETEEPEYSRTIRKYHSESKIFKNHYIKEDVERLEDIEPDNELVQFRTMLQKHDWSFEFSDDFRVYEAGKEEYSNIVKVINDLVQKDKEQELRRIWFENVPEEYKFPIVNRFKTRQDRENDNFIKRLLMVSVVVRKKDSKDLYLFLPSLSDGIIGWKSFSWDYQDIYSRQFPTWSRCVLKKMLLLLDKVDINFDELVFINVENFTELSNDLIKKVINN